MACALVCIALGLHGAGIDVVPANVPAPALSARAARRVALRNFGGFAGPYTRGWRRVGRVSVHLVEVVRSNTVGRLGLFPGQVVWLVVIRDEPHDLTRSEEHTSELQSLAYLVCRLLPEKKNGWTGTPASGRPSAPCPSRGVGFRV